jgi:O-antigen/teichoic acid export membrane protein
MFLRRLAKDSAIYGGADFLTKFIAFFSFPLIAAALNPLAFGALELIITTTGLLGIMMECGLNNSVQRFYWDKDTAAEHRPVLVSSGLATLMVFGVLALALGSLAIPFVQPMVKEANLPLTSVALFSALLLMTLTRWNQFALNIIRLHEAPWRFFGFSLTARVLTAVLGVVVVVVLGWGIDGLLGTQALVLGLCLPLAFFLIRKDIIFKIDYSWIRELICYGYPFIFAGLGYWLFGSMDRWMLASLSTIEEVGIYSVSNRFASAVLFVSTAFAQAWSPISIKIRTDHPDNYREIYFQVLMWLMLLMLVAGGGLALFSGELIGAIMPAKYAASTLPLAILCFGVILQASQHVTAVGISIEKKTFLFARLTWFTALVNLLLNYWLIPLHGAVGAAIATFASYLTLTASYLFFTQRLHPLTIHWTKLCMLLILGSCVAIVSIAWNSIEWDWGRVGSKLAIALFCLVIAWKIDVPGLKSKLSIPKQ